MEHKSRRERRLKFRSGGNLRVRALCKRVHFTLLWPFFREHRLLVRAVFRVRALYKGPFIQSANEKAAFAEERSVNDLLVYTEREHEQNLVRAKKPRRLPLEQNFRRRSRRLLCSTNQRSQFRLCHHDYYVTALIWTIKHCDVIQRS